MSIRTNAEVTISETEELKAEVTALRRAIIHLHTIMEGRHRDAGAAWAIREAANCLSVPFSDDAVEAKYKELTEGEPQPPEIRRREDGSFDEIVARDCFVHFEMMDDNFLWVGITTKDGKTLSVDVLAEIPKRRKRPVIRVVTRDESTLPTAADSAEAKQS